MTRRSTGLLCSSLGAFVSEGQFTVVAGNSGNAVGRVAALASMAQAIAELVHVVRHHESSQTTRPIGIPGHLRSNHSNGL
jgi:hypothetical protein